MTTEYADVLDQSLVDTLKPYRTGSSGLGRAEVEGNVNRNFFLAYGPRLSIKTPGAISVEPLFNYQLLLQSVAEIEGLRFATARESLKVPPEAGELVCHIRHDVDGDLVAALSQARIESALGIQTTYYLLHTAPYYGVFEGGVFKRHESSIEIYKEIQSLGHEIALHTDGLTLYQDMRIDGADAVATELEWLRSHGLDVTGTVSHNSFSVYGANNFSIFKGRPLAVSNPAMHAQVVHNGKWSPLQMLDEKELGLEYEGNDLFWQPHTNVEYFCLMRQNAWYWQTNLYNQLADSKERPKISAGWKSQHGVVDRIRESERQRYVLLAVHPMYYGMRSDPEQVPFDPAATSVSTNSVEYALLAGARPVYGFRSLLRRVKRKVLPLKVQEHALVFTNDAESNQYQVLNELNELGEPDLPVTQFRQAEHRLIFLLPQEFCAHTVLSESSIAQVTARLFALKAKGTVSALALDYDRLKAGGLEQALQRVASIAAPTKLIIGFNQRTAAGYGDLQSLGASVCGAECEAVLLTDCSDIKESEKLSGARVVSIGSVLEACSTGGYWADGHTVSLQGHSAIAEHLAQSL